MRYNFVFQRASKSKLLYIDRANIILEEYAEKGYRLTLRQLYYQLVARDMIPNRVQEYSKLSREMVFGRMNGLVDWEHIEDRLRRPWIPYWYDGVVDAIEDTIKSYRLDRQEGQDNYLEIWTEKDAVSNILKKVSSFYHMRLVVNRGYSSCSAMYDAYNRFGRHDSKSMILYVGDYDPSGLDMIRDIRERLETFGLENFELIHTALTRDQIDEYNPPPNPAKITDPRADWYILNHGKDSWELDALKPEVLEEIVEGNVKRNIDLPKFLSMSEKEKKDKKLLKKIAKTLL